VKLENRDFHVDRTMYLLVQAGRTVRKVLDFAPETE
jgi:hypothetical protein